MDKQPENIYSILLTLEVLKFDKSNEVKLKQFWNIFPMSFTL